MNRKNYFTIILGVTLLLAYLVFFGFKAGGINIPGASQMRFGIDIRGGVDAALTPKDLDRQATGDELEAARTIIETRLDQRNILDRDVTIDKTNGYIFVRFPWQSSEEKFDPETAISELGDMAHLTFRDPDGKIVLEGKHVETTTWGKDNSSMGYAVHLKLKTEGQELFAEATARLVGQSISIYMDETMISSPTVKQAINSNECVISDISTAEEANLLSNQINSGALPFALTTRNYSAISPILGANALEMMITAGIVAYILICIGLILYYRLSGIVASIALLLQIAGQIAMLLWPGFTVTLPGIAGIILAIGMGVDANIIASERIREELRTGKSVVSAVNSGFARAFSSIFDGNVTVLIVAFIMMFLGSGSILSFAYTLLFGIIMNFVAGVIATRLMTSSLVQYENFRDTSSFLSDKSLEKEVRIYPFFQKRKTFYIISGVVMAVGLIMCFVNGVKLDIQFTGGAILKYDITESVDLDMDDAAVAASEALGGRLVTAQITTDYANNDNKLVLNLAGVESLTTDDQKAITESLANSFPEQKFDIAEINNVEPFFGKQFLQKGVLAVLISFVMIIVYVWFSFRKIHGLSAGAMALLSLLHDVLVVFFTFVIFQIPIGDSFIAVALTILGYSINDTIVIYDRIRENTQLFKDKNVPVEDLVDRSISQSFTRSLYTNLAVFLSVALILAFASWGQLDSVRAFALPMCIGTISGCYSTVCIAGPTWAMWEKRKK